MECLVCNIARDKQFSLNNELHELNILNTSRSLNKLYLSISRASLIYTKVIL